MKKFLLFNITGTGLRTIVGLDNMAWVKIVSGTVMEIYYTGSSSLKTTITFGTSDTTYAPHYAVMQAFNDAMVGATQPGGFYTVPTLPLKPSPSSATDYNTISTIAYA